MTAHRAAMEARIARLNRMACLAGLMTSEQLEGLIVLAEAATSDPRTIESLTLARAKEALAYALPDGVF